MFEITFEAGTGEFETDGKITVGDHSESFTASHSVWDRGRYEQEWRAAADRVAVGEPGCFVVDLASGGADYKGEAWIVWPERDVGVVQNQLLLPSSGFDPDRPHLFLPAVPQRLTEDGHRVSTWRVGLTDIETWRQRQARRHC
jgi:hypothetical protein